MPALRLLVAYDGTEFSGFASQPGPRTVQGVLTEALQSLSPAATVRVTGAGRTDAGVHALGQVVSLPLLRVLGPEDVLRALAGRLPPDLGVLDAAEGPEGFDARRSARWRSYAYLIWTGDARHPLFRRFSTWIARPLDLASLRDALGVVVGTHDFSSFARVREGQRPTRTVMGATAERDGQFVRIRVTADSFLHQMVRSIVGSAIEVASGRRTRAWMREALLARDRAAAGPVASPQGLTLVDVGYAGAPWARSHPTPWPWAGDARSVPHPRAAERCS